jgi:hypothetical protein
MRRILAVGLGALLLAGVVVACGASPQRKPRSAGGDDDDAPAAGKDGGMLRLVWAQEPRFHECYEEARRAKPDLVMRVSLIMNVTADGRVDYIAVTSGSGELDPKLKECLTGIARDIKFPATGKAFKLTPAVVFRPQ